MDSFQGRVLHKLRREFRKPFKQRRPRRRVLSFDIEMPTLCHTPVSATTNPLTVDVQEVLLHQDLTLCIYIDYMYIHVHVYVQVISLY